MDLQFIAELVSSETVIYTAVFFWGTAMFIIAQIGKSPTQQVFTESEVPPPLRIYSPPSRPSEG